MRKKIDRRTATTLIELIVVLVMMGFFIMMVFHLFGVTFAAYNFNRELAAKTYAQANVDNFFEIFERELMYSGSLGGVIKYLDDYQFKSQPSILIGNASITVQYALAEQLILTKKNKDNYGDIREPSFAATEFTYFPLYKASMPEPLTNRWALDYNDINSVSSAATLNIATITSNEATIVITGATYTATMFELELTDSSTPATYVSILLNEKAFDSLEDAKNKIKLEDNATWTGEMIYKTTIFLDASDLKIRKYIPTINSSYTLTLYNDVNTFEATEISDLNIYIATVTYSIPDIEPSTDTISVTRRFFKP